LTVVFLIGRVIGELCLWLVPEALPNLGWVRQSADNLMK
jgi:hypothetical protein